MENRIRFSTYFLFLFLTVIAGCTTPANKKAEIALPVTPASTSDVYVGFPKDQEVVFYGKQNTDHAEGLAGNMMYPGYNAASFLAGILTHAAIQGGINSAEEKRHQEKADEVLNSYQTLLDQLNGHMLLEKDKPLNIIGKSVFAHLLADKNSQENVYVVNTKPTYYLTQSERSLMLKNTITVFESNRPEAGSKTINIVYTSSPISTQTPDQYWTENNYANFAYELKTMFRESLQLGIASYWNKLAPENKTQQTIRYNENGEKKVERGYLISRDCDRILFISLRDAIKSVPTLDADQACTTSQEPSTKNS